MTRTRRRPHAKRIAKKRRVWSDGTPSSERRTRRARQLAWLRTLLIVLAIAVVVVLAPFYFIGKLPEIEDYFAGRASQDAGAPLTNLAPVVAPPATSAPQTEHNVAQENLQAARFGLGVKIVNEGETPIHLTRVVRNKMYRVAWCDTDANVNRDPNQLPNFAIKVDQVLQIGDSYISFSYPACGPVDVIEVFTGQGLATFKLPR